MDKYGFDSSSSESIRSDIIVCPMGSTCVNGVKKACPGGSYGSTEGLYSESCSGTCPEGFYCPAGSVEPFAHSCGRLPKQHCPAGSERPHVTGWGYFATTAHFNTGGGYGSQEICPRGSYCIDGIRSDCPSGHFGSMLQQTNSSCSGLCSAGYYCPEGSWSDKQHQCYSEATFCPEGSGAPLNCEIGYYTGGIGGAEIVASGDNVLLGHARTAQYICEPGFYCIGDGKSALTAN